MSQVVCRFQVSSVLTIPFWAKPMSAIVPCTGNSIVITSLGICSACITIDNPWVWAIPYESVHL